MSLKTRIDIVPKFCIIIGMSRSYKIKPMSVKVRKSWGELNPAMRRLESQKLYKRHAKYGKRYSES